MTTDNTQCHKPRPFFLNNSEDVMYFNSKELQAYDIDFYYGCKTRPRNIINKKNIPTTAYIYANFNALRNSWVISTAECKKAQLIISQNWIETNMPSMHNKANISDKDRFEKMAYADLERF